MNNLLVINCGSSSIKISVFEQNTLKKIFEHTDREISDIRSNLKRAFETLNFDFKTIAAVGHRFVHGGPKYITSVRLDKNIIQDLSKLSDLAPLHNEPSLKGIQACFDFFGDNIPEIAVFDTAFHSHIPKVAANYAIPHSLTEKYSIKRYGFHGISHAFLWERYVQQTGKKSGKIITIHLGNGCSITAIRDGQSIDTSMGFTPAEGLIMATRAGDIDAAIAEFLCRKENKSPEQIMDLLNHQSGLLGISTLSSKMEDLEKERKNIPLAQLAIDMFCYRVVKYIGAYLAVLHGADAIIFSGGIGENSPYIREQIINAMVWFGIALDQILNAKAIKLTQGDSEKISTSGSTVMVFVTATDENQLIAESIKVLLLK